MYFAHQFPVYRILIVKIIRDNVDWKRKSHFNYLNISLFQLNWFKAKLIIGKYCLLNILMKKGMICIFNENTTHYRLYNRINSTFYRYIIKIGRLVQVLMRQPYIQVIMYKKLKCKKLYMQDIIFFLYFQVMLMFKAGGSWNKYFVTRRDLFISGLFGGIFVSFYSMKLIALLKKYNY